MPSICRGNVALPEWSNVGAFEHFLELLDIMNDALNIHPEQYSGRCGGRVGHWQSMDEALLPA